MTKPEPDHRGSDSLPRVLCKLKTVPPSDRDGRLDSDGMVRSNREQNGVGQLRIPMAKCSETQSP
jgi:hypothetical protein